MGTPFFVSAYEFVNDLKIGETSSDIAELQKILNSDVETQIASSGPGSKGNETNYFGNLTKQAVIRFQEKYGEEILLPNGLQLGTGFVGPATRNKLNSFKATINPVNNKLNAVNNNLPSQSKLSFYEVNPKETAKINTYFDGNLAKVDIFSDPLLKNYLLGSFFVKNIKIYNVNPYQAKPGQKVLISGTGFEPENNTFNFGNTEVNKISCNHSTSCEVVVPESINLGEVEVNVKNKNGNTNNKNYSVKVYITNNPKDAPKILGISKKDIKSTEINSEITIKAQNLTSENYVYSPLGKIGPFAENDGSIKIDLGKMPDINSVINKGKELKVEFVPIPLNIENKNGTSDFIFVNIIINK